MVERLNGIQEVRGSIPLGSISSPGLHGRFCQRNPATFEVVCGVGGHRRHSRFVAARGHPAQHAALQTRGPCGSLQRMKILLAFCLSSLPVARIHRSIVTAAFRGDDEQQRRQAPWAATSSTSNGALITMDMIFAQQQPAALHAGQPGRSSYYVIIAAGPAGPVFRSQLI